MEGQVEQKDMNKLIHEIDVINNRTHEKLLHCQNYVRSNAKCYKVYTVHTSFEKIALKRLHITQLLFGYPRKG
jgi:hypothetical protein